MQRQVARHTTRSTLLITTIAHHSILWSCTTGYSIRTAVPRS